jgi:outer membrane lipoprotein LolB
MRRARRHATALAACLLGLASCQGPAPLRSGGPDPLAERRAALDSQADWSFEGRAALSNGKDAVTVRLEWRQHGRDYELILRAPVSGETWRLSVDGAGARLEGGGKPPRRAADPEQLLERESGLRVPVVAMADWARGLSHDPARAEVALDAEGRVELIRESGWQIRVRSYDDGTEPARPRSLEAERSPYKVRLAIAAWRTGP